MLLENNGEMELKEIGKFCDERIEGREEGKAEIKNENIRAPCFDRDTHEIRWKPVTHVFRHENKNDTYSIKTERGREIKVTGNHSLFTFDSESLSVKEVEASELDENSLVLAPEKIPEPDEQITELNLIKLMNREEVENHNWYVYGIDREILEEIKSGKKIRKKPSEDSNRKRTYYRYKDIDILKDSLDNNYIPKQYLPVQKVIELGLEDEVKDCYIKTYQVGGKESEIPVSLELTPEIMRFFGLYVAEGHADKRQIGFTVNTQETAYQRELVATADEQLNVNTTLVKRERNSARVKAFGGPLGLIMKKLCGTGAKTKQVPSFVFKTSQELRQHFIDGLYNGDDSDAYPSNQLTLTTASKKLAREVSYLWNMQGVVASWEEKISSGYTDESKIYNVTIYGEDIKKSNCYDVGNHRKASYRMIPSQLLDDISIESSDSSFVKPDMGSIFSHIGLGAQREWGERFYKKIEKIKEDKGVEEDYYTGKLEELDLIVKKDDGFEITPKMDQKLEKIEEILKFAKSDLTLLNVNEIEKIKSPKFVYDISVPGKGSDENFVGGSKGALFVKNSRGQQGIGISAAVLYSQLTRGKPVIIHSKPDESSQTKQFYLNIDTIKNEPEIVKENTVEGDMDHTGTRIEMHIEGKYINRYHSVDEYLQQTAIMNPYAEILYESPEGEKFEFPRAVEKLPKQPKEIKPHPHGVELGVLTRMMKNTDSRTISSFLQNEFTRVGSTSAEQIYRLADLEKDRKPTSLKHEEQERLLEAMQKVNLMRPPTDCLSPIGKELMENGLRKEINPEFVAAVSRDPTVYRGNPFQIEAAIAYGGDLMEEKDSSVKVLRFANKVPLLYQASSCSITKAVIENNWKRYGLEQPGGNGTPKGPAMILVHMASTWVPFTSESKESIATYPTIVKEIKLAVQDCARKLQKYIRKEQTRYSRITCH
ncbi:MAG: DNA topoisomerase VI subunit B [Candidatus Aenigmatarchaeota archaeon]